MAILARDALGRAVPVPDPKKRTWHWRAEAFRLDHCQGEGRRHHRELHVHHIDCDYRNLDPANLLTLCRWCHAKAHGKKPSSMGWVRAR